MSLYMYLLWYFHSSESRKKGRGKGWEGEMRGEGEERGEAGKEGGGKVEGKVRLKQHNYSVNWDTRANPPRYQEHHHSIRSAPMNMVMQA